VAKRTILFFLVIVLLIQVELWLLRLKARENIRKQESKNARKREGDRKREREGEREGRRERERER